MNNSGTPRSVIAMEDAVEQALRRAAAAARREYVRAGLSMPVWRRGEVVWIEPAELETYEADDRVSGSAPPVLTDNSAPAAR